MEAEVGEELCLVVCTKYLFMLVEREMMRVTFVHDLELGFEEESIIITDNNIILINIKN
jgi:hypothetical protein